MRWIMSVALALLVTAPGAPASEAKPEIPSQPVSQGSFHGELVAGPRAERAPGVLWLRGDDGNVLRVVAARAAVVYEASAPMDAEHHMPALHALVPGAEVVVTALLEGQSGEWNASRVEILVHHAAKPHKDASASAEEDEDDDGVDDPLQSAQANRRTI